MANRKDDIEKKYVSIDERWKGINWDVIQRIRFMNADAEIPPEDSFTEKYRNKKADD